MLSINECPPLPSTDSILECFLLDFYYAHKRHFQWGAMEKTFSCKKVNFPHMILSKLDHACGLSRSIHPGFHDTGSFPNPKLQFSRNAHQNFSQKRAKIFSPNFWICRQRGSPQNEILKLGPTPKFGGREEQTIQ